jgi:hypothetical protein
MLFGAERQSKILLDISRADDGDHICRMRKFGFKASRGPQEGLSEVRVGAQRCVRRSSEIHTNPSAPSLNWLDPMPEVSDLKGS